MNSDDNQYEQWQKNQEAKWESLCTRCGACCGTVEGDPCEHLRGNQKGSYFCSIYDHRFGPKKTVSGKTFICVPIRNIIDQTWPGDACCGYKKSK